MLNRSLLRARVFHRLYGLKVVLDGTLSSYFDRIKEEFVFDPESGEKLEAEIHKELSQEQIEKFLQMVKLDSAGNSKEDSDFIKGLFQEYKGQLGEELPRSRKALLESAENVGLAYLSVLDFLIALGDMASKLELEKERNLPKGLRNRNPYKNIKENPLLDVFRKMGPFSGKKGIQWKREEDCIRMVFLDALKNDEDFKAYLTQENPSIDQHRDILLHLISEKVFSHQGFNSIFEDRFITWFQDKKIVRNMVRKFTKDLDIQSDENEHTPLSGNWEEDKGFFLELWDHTLEDWPENEKFLAEQAKNWDPERIALADKVLIIMGMAEFVHFPSIPVKVTINEYIELSKKYSTPNSKTFVNGVLDKVSAKWLKSGKIKKSGRGLIDNK